MLFRSAHEKKIEKLAATFTKEARKELKVARVMKKLAKKKVKEAEEETKKVKKKLFHHAFAPIITNER